MPVQTRSMVAAAREKTAAEATASFRAQMRRQYPDGEPSLRLLALPNELQMEILSHVFRSTRISLFSNTAHEKYGKGRTRLEDSATRYNRQVYKKLKKSKTKNAPAVLTTNRHLSVLALPIFVSKSLFSVIDLEDLHILVGSLKPEILKTIRRISLANISRSREIPEPRTYMGQPGRPRGPRLQRVYSDGKQFRDLEAFTALEEMKLHLTERGDNIMLCDEVIKVFPRDMNKCA